MQSGLLSSTISALFIALALCACGSGDASFVESSEDEEMAQLDQPIVGGDTDRQRLAVLAIATITPDIEALCTGTLIAPNLVLTARHCVVPTDSRVVDCDEGTFADPYEAAMLWVTPSTTVRNAELFPVRQVTVPPNDAASCGSDIALLTLDGQFSSRIPIKAPRLDLPARRGETVTAVGFGSALSEGAPGVRRAISDVEVLCGPEDCDSPELLTNTEFVSAQGACEGDSGGPALDSRERVVGVASRTNEECTFAVYSAISPWNDWIVSVAERALSQGDYDAPEWLAGAGVEDSDPEVEISGEPEPGGDGSGLDGDQLPGDELVSSSGDSGCSLSGARAGSAPSSGWLAAGAFSLALGLSRRASRRRS